MPWHFRSLGCLQFSNLVKPMEDLGHSRLLELYEYNEVGDCSGDHGGQGWSFNLKHSVPRTRIFIQFLNLKQKYFWWPTPTQASSCPPSSSASWRCPPPGQEDPPPPRGCWQDCHWHREVGRGNPACRSAILKRMSFRLENKPPCMLYHLWQSAEILPWGTSVPSHHRSLTPAGPTQGRVSILRRFDCRIV